MSAPLNNKYAEGNDGGRPTKFTEDTIRIANEYIGSCEDSFDENGRLVVNLPTVAGLALRLNVSRETVYAWKSENREFSDIVAKLMSNQEKALISGGLSNKYNATITKLILTKHGYSDKQELMGKDGEKLEMGVVILPPKNESSLEASE